MPLVDLKSNLSSIRFTGNRVVTSGGLNASDPSSKILNKSAALKKIPFPDDGSGQPFVRFPIDGTTTNPTIKKLYTTARTYIDFPIRGGGIDYNAQNQTFTVFSEIDKQRIKAFLESKPRGAAFIQKQIGLQLSNPNTQTGFGFYGGQVIAAIPSVLQNTKIYRSQNTLAQIGFSGTGLHANRNGVLPVNSGGLVLGAKYYSDIVGSERLLDAPAAQQKNRLLILNSLKMTAGSGFTLAGNLTNLNEINYLGISRNKGVLFDYLTGPGSVYGIGKTTIKRYDDTRKAGEDWSNSEQVKTWKSPVLTYDQIQAKARTGFSGSKVNFSGSRESIYSLNLGSYGGSDGINMETVSVIFGIDTDPWANTNLHRDMIKFGFECIDNNNPENSTFIRFRALLNGAISDNNGAQYSPVKYLGRGEEFFVYQGFTRNINFSFLVVAMSKDELFNMYEKLNYLVSQVYPDYSPSTKMMRAPMIRLTIGDYLYRQLGFIESINLTIENTTSWEINYDKSVDLAELPQMIGVNVSFKPIFNELPQRSTKGVNKTRIVSQTVQIGNQN
jgi:hypothetical protein